MHQVLKKEKAVLTKRFRLSFRSIMAFSLPKSLNGTLRANTFTGVEITLGALLGIWKQTDPNGESVQFLQDIEIVYSTVECSRKDYGTVTLPYDKINSENKNDYHLLTMLLVKKMLKQFFPWLEVDPALSAKVTQCYGYLRIANSEFARVAVADDAPLKTILERTHQLLNPTVAFTQTSEVLCLATDGQTSSSYARTSSTICWR
jgi:hypothetical protein